MYMYMNTITTTDSQFNTVAFLIKLYSRIAPMKHSKNSITNWEKISALMSLSSLLLFALVPLIFNIALLSWPEGEFEFPY